MLKKKDSFNLEYFVEKIWNYLYLPLKIMLKYCHNILGNTHSQYLNTWMKLEITPLVYQKYW